MHEAENIVESQSDQEGFGSVLLGGFSSLMDGVTIFGQLTLQQQLREQFPEQFTPSGQRIVVDPAVAELGFAQREPITLELVLDAFKNANPVYIGGVLAAVGALYFVLK